MIINDVNSLMRWKTSPLPTGFTLLNWLQGDGNTTASCPYINLGFYFQKTDNFKIEIDAQITTIRTRNTFFGKFGTGTSNWRTRIGANATTFFFAAGNDITTGYIDTNRHLFVLDKENLKWYIDSDNGTLTTNTSGQDNINYYLFGGNMTTDNYRDYSNARIYDFKAYLAGDLYSHCLPAMRDLDSVVGMYDIVRNTFLTNAGTGSFTYG